MKKGDLYVGNVGQNDLEEVEFVTSGSNHGWPIKEGTKVFIANGNMDAYACDPADGPFPCPAVSGSFVDPIAQYDTHREGHAVIGGFVYRGSELMKLKGRYIFGDFSLIFRFPVGPQDYGRLFHLKPGGKKGLRKIEEFQILPGNSLSLALLGWGEDADGELYPMGNISGLPFFDEGVVVKIVPAK